MEPQTPIESNPEQIPTEKTTPPLSHRSFRSFLHGTYAVSNRGAWLICIIYLLLLLSRLIDAAFLDRGNQYLSTVLLQFMIFPIPAYIYIRLQEKGYVKRLRLTPFPLSHLFLLLTAMIMLICGCTLLSMLCGMMNSQTSFTLYDTFISLHDGTARASIRLVLTYGLLPAFCEELVFRGIICAELEKHGILYASLLSSLFFAFLHFDLSALPVYLFGGWLLCTVMYVTRSTIAAMVVHLGYNLFGIFIQAGLSGYYRSTGSIGLLTVILVILLLLSAALFCGEVARILRRRARMHLLDDPHKIETSGLNRLSLRQWPLALCNAFACPPAILAIILWLFGVIMNIAR